MVVLVVVLMVGIPLETVYYGALSMNAKQFTLGHFVDRFPP